MKKKILIIGNGFDLNLGLKTAYSHFLDSKNFKELLLKKNHIALYLQNKRGLENWVDVELSLKNYADIVLRDGLDFKTSKNEYKELVESFVNYLSGINLRAVDKDSKAYKFLVENCLRGNTIADVMIYNFNYTPSVKEILKNCGWQESDFVNRYTHVHGSLETSIIFGIQDDTELSKLHTCMQKSSASNFQRCNLSDDLLKNYDVEIFGYSFGETDEMYFKLPFHRLSSLGDSYKSNMVLYYYGEDSLDSLNHRLVELTGSQMTNFQRKINLDRRPLKDGS